LRFVDDGGDEYPDELFPVLAKLEDESFWFRSRNRLIKWALERYGNAPRSFLEVGCGTGYVLAGMRSAFPTLQLTGVELFFAGLPFARARVSDAELLQADAASLPFRDEFAAAGAFDVLEHIPDDDAALAGISEAIQPGGLLLVTVPQHPWLWSAPDEVAGHKRRYTRRELATKVERAGFEVLKLTSFVSLLLPAMAVSRRMRRGDHRDYDIASEFRTTQSINRLLERIMVAELSAIRRGVTFPVGGSLFVAATRR